MYAIEAMMTTRSMEELHLKELPTLQKVMSQVHISVDEVSYQETQLFHCEDGITLMSLPIKMDIRLFEGTCEVQ